MRKQVKGSGARKGGISHPLLLTVAVTAVVTRGIAALLVTIFERKQEARDPYFRAVPITDNTETPAEWGKNFPAQ